MKTIYSKLLSIFLSLVLLSGCGLDNYDEPESFLTGKVVYQGEALQLRGTNERVRLQLYQDGYAYHNPIEAFVKQDGSFSVLLFNGTYKIVTRDLNGPWVNSRDTTVVTVKGNTEMNIEVTPFFTVSDADMTLSAQTVKATFTIHRIVKDAEIERVLLLVNDTQFIDDEINRQRLDITDQLSEGTVSYSMELNEEAQKAAQLNGRVCVWTKGADEGIYSQVIKLR